MIARIWRATATPSGAGAYQAHFDEAVLPALRGTDGFVRAHLLRREAGPIIEIQVITWWESLDKIRNFAGAALGTAVVEPAARAALTDYDTTVTHYEVTTES
ncbi:antibiotic biosynthesis monooxygenase family protein [Nonomuraea sediminis]|uniref:antibiotic biosynthesis monooxygenase family protein n=1 Tax=Nonomuraea sediminis TaxID=2835864 RepID=UPI001BDC40EF|nr:hypothetical protein [Nonomuraea sediminis]